MGLGCRCSSISPAFSEKYSIHLRDIILQCFGVYFKRLVTFDEAYRVCFVCLFAELLNAFGRGFLRGFWRIFGWDLARLFRNFSSDPAGLLCAFLWPCKHPFALHRPALHIRRALARPFTALLQVLHAHAPFTVLLQVLHAHATFVSQSLAAALHGLLQVLRALATFAPRFRTRHI